MKEQLTTAHNNTEQSSPKPKKDSQGRAYGTGRRKQSTARVWIKPGSGKITINQKDIEHYFGRAVLKMIINQPFEKLNMKGNFDVSCTVKSGGLSGQAKAIQHGIARALLGFDPEFRSILKKEGFLTRDPRKVERKKPGQPKARKKFQYSKR